jgi:hypothetical protein
VRWPQKLKARFVICNMVKPKSIFGMGGYPFVGVKHTESEEI